MDEVAQKKWEGLFRGPATRCSSGTNTAYAPWTIVHTDEKKDARIAIIRHLLQVLAPADVREGVHAPDASVLYSFEKRWPR